MRNKNDYLPTKCWFDNNSVLHRAFYEYEEDVWEHVRDFDTNLGTIVNASKYCLGGSNDIETNDIEEWLIRETGINEEWYERNYKRYGGISGLINKFEKQCIAFECLSVYDHSGISVSCGKAYGWDYSNVGFIYVPKDNEEVKDYRKTHTLEETQEWADGILHQEVDVLDDYCRGNVYCLIHEVYDKETETWEMEDTIGMIYLTSKTFKEEEEMALEEIKYNFSGKHELLESDVVEKAIEENEVDVLQGQGLLNFDTPEVTSISEEVA